MFSTLLMDLIWQKNVKIKSPRNPLHVLDARTGEIFTGDKP